MLKHQLVKIKTFFDRDPRHFQIAFLSLFLVAGVLFQYLNIELLHIACFIACALLFQYAGDFVKQQTWNWKSALITSLSLCLLLRVPSVSLVVVAAAVAIFSKFIFRINNKHIFNPANLAIVACVLLFDAWISPGQWGRESLLVFVFFGLGFIVSTKAARVDVALIFLGSYFLLLFARALYLNDELIIPVHQMQNGALLLFAFFMITDPRTSPNHALARVIYAAGLALLAYILQFHFYVQQGMLFALVLVCSAVPILNFFYHARSYEWSQLKQPSIHLETIKEN